MNSLSCTYEHKLQESFTLPEKLTVQQKMDVRLKTENSTRHRRDGLSKYYIFIIIENQIQRTSFTLDSAPFNIEPFSRAH